MYSKAYRLVMGHRMARMAANTKERPSRCRVRLICSPKEKRVTGPGRKISRAPTSRLLARQSQNT